MYSKTKRLVRVLSIDYKTVFNHFKSGIQSKAKSILNKGIEGPDMMQQAMRIHHISIKRRLIRGVTVINLPLNEFDSITIGITNKCNNGIAA